MSGPSAVAGWAVEALIASTLLMLAVLAVRAPVRRAFGARIAYLLWALPLMRLAMPPLPASWRPPAALPIERAGETVTVLIVSAPPAATVVTAPDWIAVVIVAVAAAWAIGVAAFLLYHAVRHRRFCQAVLRSAASIEQRSGIRLVTSAAAAGPLAFGVWRRTVAVPLDFAERYDADEQALALAHEFGHHRRGDLIANWAALGVLALHWFNPIAWYAFRAFRTDQELATDAAVLADRSVVERHTYACAIVKTAIGGSVAPTCHLHTVTDLKGRLRMLSLSPASRRRLASGAAVVAGLAVAGLGFTASGSSAAAIGTGVKDTVAQVAALPALSSQSAADAPPLPPASPAAEPTSVAGDRGPQAARRIVIVKDPNDPDERIEVQEIPAISSANCGIGSGEPAMVVDTGKGQRRKIVICTDRIRRATADAMVTLSNGKDLKRNAYSQALVGLTNARASIVARADMSDTDRTRALTAIDQSIVEMKGQLARMN